LNDNPASDRALFSEKETLNVGAANLLRGAIADLERVRAAAHVEAEARPGKWVLENALSHVT
jgi:hypothetical protein